MKSMEIMWGFDEKKIIGWANELWNTSGIFIFGSSLIYYTLLHYPFINHVGEFFFFQGMIIEMVFNNKNQIYVFQNQFIYIYIYAHYQKNFKNKFVSYYFDKILVIYQISKMMFCVMF